MENYIGNRRGFGNPQASNDRRTRYINQVLTSAREYRLTKEELTK